MIFKVLKGQFTHQTSLTDLLKLAVLSIILEIVVLLVFIK